MGNEINAPGGFAPIFSHVKLELYRRRDYAKLHVLEVIAMHCDPVGITWVSDYKIARIAGHSESRVKGEIEDLVHFEYLRIHIEQSALRRRSERTIQLCPHILYIAPDQQEVAWQLWSAATVTQLKLPVLTKVGEPITEKTETEKTAGNQKQYQQQHQQQIENPLYGGENTTTRQKTAAAADAALDVMAEAYAKHLQQQFGMTLPQARGLLVEYPAHVVQQTAESILQQAQRTGNVRNPGGLLVAVLRDGGLTAQEQQQNTLTGKYSDFFE